MRHRQLADITGVLVRLSDHNVNDSKELAEELGGLLVEKGYKVNFHNVIALFRQIIYKCPN